jgi:hypothetical protein
MLGFGASARDTADKPAPKANAPKAAFQPIRNLPAATIADPTDTSPAMAETAMYLPQY